MPNHFHFLIYTDERTIQTKKIGNIDRNVLSEGFRNLLSSYSKGVNKQNDTKGSLFQQNTRAVSLHKSNVSHAPICFHYIHQNPYKAKLVKKMEDWAFSSFKDYIGVRNGTLCNRQLAFDLLDMDIKTFYSDSYNAILENDLINKIFCD